MQSSTKETKCDLRVAGYWHTIGDTYPTRDWTWRYQLPDGLDDNIIASNGGIKRQIDSAIELGKVKDGKVMYFVLEKND
jgi:hypothetical protein